MVPCLLISARPRQKQPGQGPGGGSRQVTTEVWGATKLSIEDVPREGQAKTPRTGDNASYTREDQHWVLDGTDSGASARTSAGPVRSGVSFEHPVAFWVGVTITTIGVLLQLPDYFACRDMHYQMAGMPVSINVSVGMALLVVGVAVTGYGLFPTGQARKPQSTIRIGPLDNAPLRPAHLTLLVVIAAAVTIDVMKPVSLAFVAPGAAAEYGLRGPLNPTAQGWSIGWYPLAGITGTMIGSFIWGWMADRIGRRSSILLAAIIFMATSTCATMPEYWMNLVTCFVMGLGAG